MKRVRVLVVGCSLLVSAAAVGCSSGSEDKQATSGNTTTTAAADPGTEAAYAEQGPNPVGTFTIALDDGRRVVVWYPAVAAAADQPTENFDIASLLSPELQAKVPADKRPQYEIDAHVGADPAGDGPYPVVLFSHGYAGFPEQSADLVTHLASWGFVVIAPDHVERSLSGLLGTASRGVKARTDAEVLSASLDAAVDDAKRANSPLRDLMDLDEVAVAGHSAGAAAAYLTAAADPRIKAFIAYSVGFSKDGEPIDPADVPKPPTVPGMVMIGKRDGIIPPAESEAVYDAMQAPKYEVEIADAGHLVFSDICRIGRDQGGLVSLVHQTGLDIPEQLLGLAKDGCEKGYLRPDDAFAAIDHLSVAFLRSSLGIDKEPVGLDPAVTKAFDTADVTLTADA